VILLFNDRGHQVDGIRDHTRNLKRTIEKSGNLLVFEHERVPVDWRFDREILRSTGSSGDQPTAVILQYSPFCYGRWGFAPWLMTSMVRMRLRRSRPRLALNVHEPYVPVTSWRTLVMGGWQRFQLAVLRYSADVVLSSVEEWQERFARTWPSRPAHHLPVASNFPDRRAERADERRRLGATEKTIVIGALGRDHPSWMPAHVTAAANSVAAHGHDVLLLNLGAETQPLAGLDPAVRVERPGFLTAAEVGARIAACDIFVSPLIDGVSTRRGTVMAALQHGVPVVGTEGPLTDTVLREARGALTLVPVDRPDELAGAALALASSTSSREAGGVEARALYERCFDWPIVANRLLDALQAVEPE
jgi:glycosyltransferase involved in cell wall biosynthesis